MDVEQHCEQLLTAPRVLTTLLQEFSAISDYQTLQESLPRRLADLLCCRCILLYMRIGDTLQFTAGSFDDTPGWSASLLAVAHINPIGLHSELPEARAWRTHQVIAEPEILTTLLVSPLLYRHRCVGVLLALRGAEDEGQSSYWQVSDRSLLEAVAGVVALLLENTRLLERDRERIHELSLLNSISSQMNYSLYELERMRRVVLQRTREIATTDVSTLLEPNRPSPEWLPAPLQSLLFQRFTEQHSLLPLVVERPGDGNPRTSEYLQYLPPTIRTFFAVPLLSGRALGRHTSSLLHTHNDASSLEPPVLGIIVGAYYRNRKLFREELVLLQVLSSQAGAVLENIHLMTEVIEARNEARKLLRQVLDDQRFKELIFESIPSGLITTDQHGIITTFNRAAEAILGYRPHEVLGKPLELLLDFQSCPPLKLRWAQFSSHSSDFSRCSFSRNSSSHDLCSGTLLFIDRDGHDLFLDLSILPLSSGLSEPIGSLVTFTDVTSLRRLEEEKRRLDRLASLGEMAANVAHEVRNPLASIKTSMQMLLDDLGSISSLDSDDQNSPGAFAQESVSVVLKEVERLDLLVRELLLFARPHQLHRVKCDLPSLSDHVLLLLQHQFSQANVLLQCSYIDAPPLFADLGQMEQVLLNLYMNALQAMPDGGLLSISLRSLPTSTALSDAEHASSLQTRQSAALIQGYREHELLEWPVDQWLELSVHDTGVGIPSDQLERIFQPFFTTKAHGIGLGLAITRRLIEDHGGYMLAEGTVGVGSTISVRLPVVTPEQLPAQNDELKDLEELE